MPPSSRSKTAPAQTTQPSRKGKKSWRKHVDLAAITSGLEARREEIITHGAPLSEKTGGQLFSVDVTPASAEDVRRDAGRRRVKVGKVLKQDEVLGRRSAVPALEHGKKRSRSQVDQEERAGDGIVATKKLKKDWTSKKEVARLRNNLDKASRLDLADLAQDHAEFDLWDVTPAASTALTEQHSGYEPAPKQPKVAPPTISHPPIPLTQSGRPAPSIPLPNEGTSYNPTYDAWDALLTTAGEAELLAETKRIAQAEDEADKQARIDALIAKLPDREDTGALVEDAESEWEGFETDHSGADISAAEMKRRKRPARKTPAERNKATRRKAAEQVKRHEQKMKLREDKGREIVMALIEQHAEEQHEDGAEVAAQHEPSAVAPPATSTFISLRRNPHLGPKSAHLPPQPLELTLPDELQDTLRRLRPEGNLLTDRFRTLLVNGRLEGRRRTSYAQSRKRQVKMTEKWWSKDFSVGV